MAVIEKNKRVDLQEKKVFEHIKGDNKSINLNLRNTLKNYIVDCLAIICETNVVFAFYEVFLNDLSVKTSLYFRFLGTLITISGVGYIFAKGRDKLKEVGKKFFEKYVKIKEKWKKFADVFYDIFYGALFNFTVTPLIFTLSYSISHKTTPELSKIITFSLGATILTTVNNPMLGYTIDVFRDLANIKECERSLYKHIKPKRKTLALFLLIASSFASLTAIYGIKKAFD